MRISKPWVPHEYQKKTIDFGVERTYAGFFLDPGLGKTSISLEIINVFKEKTLIIAPLRVIYQVWPGEIEKWSNFTNIKYKVLRGEDREENFLGSNIGVYLINPEGLKWLFRVISKHKYFPFKNLFVDESIKFKGHKSKRFEFLMPYLKMFKHRYILTGNPMPNNYLDLWAQIYILDQGRALGDNFYKFRNKYFYPTDFKRWSWAIKPGSDKEIQDAIRPFVIHISARDHIDLPELVINDIRFDLSKANLKHYKQMERAKFVELEEKFTAPTAAAAVQKCNQIASGFMYETLDEVDRELGKKPRTFHFHDEKSDILRDYVEDLQGSPCLILYYYKEQFLRLKKMYPHAPVIGSGVSGPEGKIIQDGWNRGEYPILLANMMSVSHGLNLQEGPGHHIIFFALTYDFDVYDQCIRRLWRQGVVSNRVIVTRIIANGTVDDVMCDTVKEKDETQSVFLNAVKLYIEKIAA